MIDPAACILVLAMALDNTPTEAQRCATASEIARMIEAQGIWDRLEDAVKKAKETAK